MANIAGNIGILAGLATNPGELMLGLSHYYAQRNKAGNRPNASGALNSIGQGLLDTPVIGPTMQQFYKSPNPATYQTRTGIEAAQQNAMNLSTARKGFATDAASNAERSRAAVGRQALLARQQSQQQVAQRRALMQRRLAGGLGGHLRGYR